MAWLFEHWEFVVAIFLGVLGFNACSLYFREKDDLMRDIKEIIDSCRQVESWDENSESKLFSWLEGSEGELHRKSPWRLRKIRKEMVRYWHIHLEMADGVEYGSYQVPELTGWQKFVRILLRLVWPWRRW